MTGDYSAAPPLPLLRTPPFPGVDRALTAISAVRSETSSGVAEAGIGPADLARAESLAALIIAARVGGSFWAPPIDSADRAETLIAATSPSGLAAMIARLDQSAMHKCRVLLPHRSWSHQASAQLQPAGALVYLGDHDPWAMLDGVTLLRAEDHDELALIARLKGVRLAACGDAEPAMAGDALARLLHTALIDKVTYRDCFTGQPIEVEQAVALLAEWRRTIDDNRGIAAGCGISWWKRREVRSFLWAGQAGQPPLYRSAAAAVRRSVAVGGDIACWPSRAPAGLDHRATAARVRVRQVEDGFIRSVGLGSGLHPPQSIVVDKSGIYYDPGRPSDLETMLAATDFSAEQIARAEHLIEMIVTHRITKYGTSEASFGDVPDGAQRILVAGQVEDDRSVKLGGGDVAGNLDLLRRVRAIEPDAHILFKPHPDVVAGHRKGNVPVAEVLRYADQVVASVPMPALLDAVDKVHVWTSLAGFEALLRGLPVTTHGKPFYAGWGLTDDRAGPFPRRRPLSLAELVFGVLVLYPRYLDPVLGIPCTPEVLIKRVAESPAGRSTPLIWLRQIQGQARALLLSARS